MATFFGEVILPSSRVFFDDGSDFEDETTEEVESPKEFFELEESISGSLGSESELLLVFDGVVAREFAHCYLLRDSAQVLAQFHYVEGAKEPADVLEVRKPAPDPTTLHSLSSKIKLLDISPAIDVRLANHLALKGVELLMKAENVIVVASRSSSEYRCNSVNDLPFAFLRGLNSSKSLSLPNLSRLENPNFISGFPASVLTIREVLDKPCQLAVCYTDTDTPDAVTLAPLQKLFSSVPHLNSLLSATPQMSKPRKDQSFMYM